MADMEIRGEVWKPHTYNGKEWEDGHWQCLFGIGQEELSRVVTPNSRWVLYTEYPDQIVKGTIPALFEMVKLLAKYRPARCRVTVNNGRETLRTGWINDNGDGREHVFRKWEAKSHSFDIDEHWAYSDTDALDVYCEKLYWHFPESAESFCEMISNMRRQG